MTVETQSVTLSIIIPAKNEAEAIGDVVESQESVFASRITPVDDEDIVSLLDEVGDHAFVGRQVEHIVSVDQGRHHHDGTLEHASAAAGPAQPFEVG